MRAKKLGDPVTNPDALFHQPPGGAIIPALTRSITGCYHSAFRLNS
jgi:hypothetical protein